MSSNVPRPDAKHVDGPPKPEPIEVLREGSVQQMRQQADALIRDSAYYLYQNGREEHGHDITHWMEAEAKFLSSNLEIRESGPWFHCNCPVTNSSPEQIHVAIDAKQVMIHFEREVYPDGNTPADLPIFFWANWPQEVDPSTAAAYVLNANLTIEVKKTDPPAVNPLLNTNKNPVT